jgi:hypothetical protein
MTTHDVPALGLDPGVCPKSGLWFHSYPWPGQTKLLDCSVVMLLEQITVTCNGQKYQECEPNINFQLISKYSPKLYVSILHITWSENMCFIY